MYCSSLGFGNVVFTVTSLWMPRCTVHVPDTEVAMNKMLLRFPTSFGEAVKQVWPSQRCLS
jgi:hypothetical protein